MFALINKDTLKIIAVQVEMIPATEDLDSNVVVWLSVPENIDCSYLKVINTDGLFTIEEDSVAKNVAFKLALVETAKAAMWTDVLAAMETTYGTTDMNSAQALQAMWSDLESNPALNISAVFPTVEAIAAYVTPRMILGRQYLAYNLGRRAQFEIEKAAILAQ